MSRRLSWGELQRHATLASHIVRVQAPIAQGRLAPLRFCGVCTRQVREVVDGTRVLLVDPKPFPGGPLLINGDRVLMRRHDGGSGFGRHECGVSR